MKIEQNKDKLLGYLRLHVGLDVGALTAQINEDRDVKYIVTKLSKTVWQREYMAETAKQGKAPGAQLKGKDKISGDGTLPFGGANLKKVRSVKFLLAVYHHI